MAAKDPAGPAADPIADLRRRWGAAGLGARDALAAAVSITRAQQLVQERLDAVLRPFDLTVPRFEALAMLLLAPGGALALGKLGEQLMVHPATVTSTIDRLEAQGLVRRAAHPADRRTKLAKLTAEGRRRIETAAAAVAQANAGMGALSSVECIQLARLVRRLRVSAGDLEPVTDVTEPPQLFHSG